MPQSQFLSDATLNWFRGTNFPAPPASFVYLSLHSADPGPAGANGEITQVVAVSRPAVAVGAFGAPGPRPAGGRQISNTSAVLFTNSAVGTGLATHFGLWTAATAGDFLAYGLVNPPTTILNGDVVEFPIGQLVVGVPTTIVS
jgi:hypothetical protein